MREEVGKKVEEGRGGHEGEVRKRWAWVWRREEVGKRCRRKELGKRVEEGRRARGWRRKEVGMLVEAGRDRQEFGGGKRWARGVGGKRWARGWRREEVGQRV